MSDKLVIVIPTYNEQENITPVLTDWYKIAMTHGENGELIVVDDGSMDDTTKHLAAFAKTHPQMSYIRQENKGHGIAVQEGYKKALEKNADYIFQTDSDGQTDPKEFEKFWKIRQKHDAIIGWRKGRKDGLYRKFVAAVLRLVLRLKFKVVVADANAPFRLIKHDALKSGMRRLPKDCVLTNAIMSAIFVRKMFSVTFVEISFERRKGGKNKMNMRGIVRTGIAAIKQMRKIK